MDSTAIEAWRYPSMSPVDNGDHQPATSTENNSNVAVVTGASAGIGRATALALADEEYDVALVARQEEKLETVAEEIETNGGRTSVFPADITNKERVSEIVKSVYDQFGGLDVLVNCAGTVYRERVVNAEPEDWQHELQVNLWGLMATSQIALGYMLDTGSGHIVNVSSLNARKAAPGASGYSASKFGVNGFSEALRQEVTTEGVRITVVEPGAVDTGMQTDDMREMLHMLEPDDIATAITYAVLQPEHVSVSNIQIRPTDQEF